MTTKEKTLPFATVPFILFILCMAGLWALGDAAKVLILAFGSVYMFFPMIKWMEKNKVPPILAVTGIFLVFTGLCTLGVFFALPPLIDEFQVFLTKLPEIVGAAFVKVREILARFHISLGREDFDPQVYINEHFMELVQNFASPFLKSIGGIVLGATSIFMWILNAILFPIFFFYLALDYSEIKRQTLNTFPKHWRPKVQSYLSQLNLILSGYLRGQLIVCIFLAVFYGLGLQFSGVQFGWLIGFVGGFLSFIPYLGAFSVVITSILVSLASSADFSVYLGIAITISIVQSVESFYLTPRLVGNKVGLNSLVAILALIAGANLAGFWGMLMAIPAAGFLKILLRDFIDYCRSEMG